MNRKLVISIFIAICGSANVTQAAAETLGLKVNSLNRNNLSTTTAIVEPIDKVTPIEPITKSPIVKAPAPPISVPLLPMSIGFEEGNVCTTPLPLSTAAIDMHRSLMVHDQETLSEEDFSLRRTLQKVADDVNPSVPGLTPEFIFQQFWDTQNDLSSAQTFANPHCSDNDGKVNGFPLNKCDRPEGMEAGGGVGTIASRIDNDYEPLALVNRIDLASSGWKNCGEHRIIYGKQGGGKNLVIFEAVLPNPKPGCRSGCRDVIEFWVNMSADSNPATRATKLADFFYNGLPGFRPVIHSEHYASGASSIYGQSNSGQIRTNQFLSGGPWTLKEFKTFLSCSGSSCDFDFMPTSVKGNPYGHLWNKDIANGASAPLPTGNPFATAIPGLAALASNFQADILGQVTDNKLGHPDINLFSYSVDPNKNAAESQSQSPVVDHYRNNLNSASDSSFKNDLDAAGGALTFPLTSNQIANRAAAMSCAGCHMPSAFGLLAPNSIGALGPLSSWPNALSFVHVDTQQVSLSGQTDFNASNFNGNDIGSNISPALLDVFLPHRKSTLVSLANNDVCNCQPKLQPSVLLPLEKQLTIQKQVQLIEKDAMLPVKQRLTSTPKLNALKESIDRFDSSALKQIQKVEQSQQNILIESGIETAQSTLKPAPVMLSAEVFGEVEHEELKQKAFDRIIKSEKPQPSIDGSFRTH